MITLKHYSSTQDIEVFVDDSIPTCDLLEVLDIFIRLTKRDPSGSLEYITPEELKANPMKLNNEN